MPSDRQLAALDAGRAESAERRKRRHALLRMEIELLASFCVHVAGPERGLPVRIADFMRRRLGLEVSARHVRRVLAELDQAA